MLSGIHPVWVGMTVSAGITDAVKPGGECLPLWPAGPPIPHSAMNKNQRIPYTRADVVQFDTIRQDNWVRCQVQ